MGGVPAKTKKEELISINKPLEASKIVPVIDKGYTLVNLLRLSVISE